MRKEDSLVEMSEERLREVFAESGHDFSADVCPGLTLADLDAPAVEDFRRRWIAKAAKAEDQALVERLQSLSPEQLLTDAEAIVDGKLTYAALILFGTQQAVGKHLAPAEVVFEYRSSDASGPAQDHRNSARVSFATTTSCGIRSTCGTTSRISKRACSSHRYRRSTIGLFEKPF
ncbi:MAG UNVERIFIED_CONTAM: hypothetical protein LVR18_10215 [Planctomycetaceae bacterium]|jgi:ATP-dependent DNA helicase RecG